MILQQFLDNFHTCLVSCSLLARNHLRLYDNGEPEGSKHHPSCLVGAVNTECRIQDLLETARQRAKLLSDSQYPNTPPLAVDCLNLEADDPTTIREVRVPCVPHHLDFVLTEVLKNAFRAVCERHLDEVDPPAVKAFVVRRGGNVVIKVT